MKQNQATHAISVCTLKSYIFARGGLQIGVWSFWQWIDIVSTWFTESVREKWVFYLGEVQPLRYAWEADTSLQTGVIGWLRRSHSVNDGMNQWSKALCSMSQQHSWSDIGGEHFSSRIEKPQKQTQRPTLHKYPQKV